ncbi:MAG TPA: hypothetical protein VN256_15200 [Pyrinomonadaceae bacterium]|nr:hypothetical protein [Pyrinomonadaceae bacterium]
MFKKCLVAAFAFLALSSVNALTANAQSSCLDHETFGTRPLMAVDKNLQSQIEVTYFTTDDPNAFISEKAGVRRSASYTSLSATQFVAKLDSLEKAGVASIRKRESASSFLGEVAELNLERNLSGAEGRMINASHASASALSGLDRRTEINVFQGRPGEQGYYRVSLLSWFVDARANGGHQTVDYDAIVLLKPGQTAVFKLMSDNEAKRTGAARSYVAVTMRAVNSASLARR